MSVQSLCHTFCNLIWANLPIGYEIKNKITEEHLKIFIRNNKKTVTKTIEISSIESNKEIMWEMCYKIAQEARMKFNE